LSVALRVYQNWRPIAAYCGRGSTYIQISTGEQKAQEKNELNFTRE